MAIQLNIIRMEGMGHCHGGAETLGCRFNYFWAVLAHFLQQHTRLKAIDSRVPKIISRLQKFLGLLLVWFFHKAPHAMPVSAWLCLVNLNITITSMRRNWVDTESNQQSLLGGFACSPHGIGKSLLVLN